MRKNAFVFCPMIVVLSVVLAACGGGGDGDAPKSDQTAPLVTNSVTSTTPIVEPAPVLPQALRGVPRGLQNLHNDCFVNTALQLLRSNPDLQVKVDESHPQGGFKAFFDAYNTNSVDFPRLHRAVVDYVRALPGVPEAGRIGEPDEVLRALGIAVGAIAFFEPAARSVEVTASYQNPDILYRIFDVIGAADADTILASMPLREKITAFAYVKPGHHMAYVRHDGKWYVLDDETAYAVDDAVIDRIAATRGVATVDGQVQPGVGLVTYL
jgi:hypothetical protein